MERIIEGVYLIDTLGYGSRNTVACYLIKSRGEAALIDTGYASTYMNVINALKEANVNLDEIKYIIPTHVHLDHAGATGHLAKLIDAKIIAHERAKKHLVDPTKLIESAMSIFGEEKLKEFGLPIPIEENRIETVKDELEVKLGDLTLRCIYTPGHAPHQISVLIEEKKTLLTADAVGIIYPSLGFMIPTTPPPSFDPIKAINTLDMLSSYDVKYLLLPHFGFRKDPSWVFEETKRKIKVWIEEITKLKKEGLDLFSILDKMINLVKKEEGVSALPFYAEQSMYVSVLGILDYLSKN